jgi:hypothetical protein
MPIDKFRSLTPALLWGLGSATIYSLLYRYADPLVEWTRQGRWTFILPVAIAFLFSIVHGTFTGQFWDLLGIKAKSVKK